MKQKQAYVLDLTKIGGSGEFTCPHCGAPISPDDCTEETYTLIEAKVNNQGLEELVIQCNKCTSQLHLTGFSLLQEMPETTKTKHNNRKIKQPEYITHM